MNLRLNDLDRSMLSGDLGEATRFAMSVVVRMADVVGASELISVEQAHIDACALMAQSNLELVSRLAEHGGRVRVPTTLNMVSLDLEHWEELGVSRAFSEQATRIAEVYTQLGCVPTWTCAPYQGYLTPRFGQQIAWGESNAVAYANSVLGARTNRYPDYFDVCAAITGRVPYSGLHRSENRRATLCLRLENADSDKWRTPAAWAALGSLVGRAVDEHVPVIDGLPPVRPSNDMLKAFGAAAASSGSVGLFHLAGVTPEAPDLAAACHGHTPERSLFVKGAQLRCAWEELSTAAGEFAVGAVILGCPHFSYEEFEALSCSIARRGEVRVHENVQFLVFASAPTIELVRRGGLLASLRRFGVTLVRDTCPFHCPVVTPDAGTIMTNSGKCAYYAPGELKAQVSFGRLDACVQAAVSARARGDESPW